MGKTIPLELFYAVKMAEGRCARVCETAQKTINESLNPQTTYDYLEIFLTNSLNTALDMKTALENETLTMGHITALNFDLEELTMATLETATRFGGNK